jgi:predicted GIY-YIG superfamily endonuclease
MPESLQRTALYRYFDAHDMLLYVGISINPDERWKAHLHQHRQPWTARSVRRTLEWRDSREDALAAEALAIRSERPLYNGTHNYDDAPFDPSSWPKATPGRKVDTIAELMRSEILGGRWSHGQRIPSLRTLGKAAGDSMRIVSQASVILQDEGLLNFQPGRGLFVLNPQKPRPKLPHDWPRAVSFPG